MDVKKLVLLIGALVIAAVSAVMAKNMFTGATAPQAQAVPVTTAPEPKGPQVLVATRTLPIGTIIDAESVRYQMWPKGLVQPAYFIQGDAGGDPKSLLGTVVRNEISAGQPITQGSLIKPGERGFLAAALGPGMRAITVSVNQTTGVAGFIFPGDRVDLVMTQDVQGGGDGPPLQVAETILRNVRVLATDQRTSGIDDEGKPEVKSASSVTLEVTPKMAEKIQLANKVGGLSLALRSIADTPQDLERAIASGDVNVPEGENPKAEKKMMLAVASRPEDGVSGFTVGGDVSRFLRSTVPGKPSSGAARDGAGAEPTGPHVRVARGTNVTFVPLGAK